MKIKRLIPALMALFLTAPAFVSCNDDTSYAELLADEDKACNNFLADHRVINSIPKDTVFETGPDAPYYRIDPDGNLYMQVLYAGTKAPENKLEDDDLVYFRFTRYDLLDYKNGELPEGSGNQDDMSTTNTWFRFNNYTIPTSSSWGYGIQAPLNYLPIDCQVNIVIKSQMGLTNETAMVVPYLYNLRYYRPSN